MSSGKGGEDWLLFLGAGASVARPTRLPTFDVIAAAVLRGIGWKPYELEGDAGRLWTHPFYPSFPSPGIAPEVLFGTLRLFDIEFVQEVADTLTANAPNAVHCIAAEVLRRGGTVWTTNIDNAVELGCAEQGIETRRAGRAAHRSAGLLEPLDAAGEGWLVKFHGSCERRATLAFTDRELLGPLEEADTRHLAELGRDRTVVLYGYAGADPDLYQLLDAVFKNAKEIVWLEPDEGRRADISRSFPDADLTFLPCRLPYTAAEARSKTGSELLGLAEKVGIKVDPELAAALVEQCEGGPVVDAFDLDEPPGVTQARIVERFGFPEEDRLALRTARWLDARHLRLHSLPAHLRWVRNDSIYNGGLLARLLRSLTNHHAVLGSVRPAKLRDYAISRAYGVLLSEGDWQTLDDLTNWAIGNRGATPGDLYYRAHARRYTLQIEDATRDAREARVGLSNLTDPERHAGALLEVGSMAIYQGRFEEALRAGFELRQRTGRFAIPRWRAWGAWLEAVAYCHLGEPGEARCSLAAARRRFEGERRRGPLQDVRTVEILAGRVDLALDQVDELPDLEAEEKGLGELRGRYRDDRCLVLADLAIGLGRFHVARRLLGEVMKSPSIPMASAWAELARAELDRLDGDRDRAGDAFARLAGTVHEGGLTWLESQAVTGLRLCGDQRFAGAWEKLRRELPGAASAESPESLVLGDPRVLWMLLT